MDRLSELSIISILHKAGARRIFTQKRISALFAYFSFAGVSHVWRIRKDAYVQNFQADVDRELGVKTEQKVA